MANRDVPVDIVEIVFLNLLETGVMTISSSSESSRPKFFSARVLIFLNILDPDSTTEPYYLAWAFTTLLLNYSWKTWLTRMLWDEFLLILGLLLSLFSSQRWAIAYFNVILLEACFKSWLTKALAWGLYLDHLE